MSHSDEKHLKYMPLPKSQRLTKPMECDGALLVVEMSDEVFVPGAKRWKEVVDVTEHKRIMQFFMFILSVCIETLCEVCLETLVSNEFGTLHKKTITSSMRVVGYRLWIPLKWVGHFSFNFLHSFFHIFSNFSFWFCSRRK